jgi:hypothetical protein
LFALQYLLDAGVLDSRLQESIYDTFLASAFRSIRFGINEAHGQGIAIQLNHLLDYGAVAVEKDGTFSVVEAKIKDGIRDLTRQVMTLQAEGDYRKAKEIVSRLGVIRPEVQNILDKLDRVPVDIAPKFTTAEQLINRNP